MFLEVLVVIHIVGESHVDGHRQLCLCGVTLAGDTLVALVVLRDFTLDFQVTVAFHLREACVVGKDIFQFVVEDILHRAPYIAGTDGEISDGDGLRLTIVDACAIETIGDAT